MSNYCIKIIHPKGLPPTINLIYKDVNVLFSRCGTHLITGVTYNSFLQNSGTYIYIVNLYWIDYTEVQEPFKTIFLEMDKLL
jgi:hypothetical protein